MSKYSEPQLKALLARHRTLSDAAKELNISRTALRKTLHRHGILYESSAISGNNRTEQTVIKTYELTDDQKPLVNWIDNAQTREKIYHQFTGAKRILILPDIHAPLVNHKALNKALEIKADLCILGGDVFDFESLSSFYSRKLLLTSEELDMSIKQVEKIIAKYKNRCIFIMGNHENRFSKTLHDAKNSSARAVQSYDLVLKEFPELARISTIIGGRMRGLTATDSHYVRIGDAAVCHFDDFSSIPGRTATDVASYFDIYHKIIDPLLPEPMVFVQCHTHRLINIIHRERLCLEIGYLGFPADYTVGRKMSTGKKDRQYSGCGLLIQNDGVTDWNQSNRIYLE